MCIMAKSAVVQECVYVCVCLEQLEFGAWEVVYQNLIT